MIENKEIINLIHIGKCGGGYVQNILKNNNFNIRVIHIEKAIFNKNEKYIILLRNPISRFISAFNWRYNIVVVNNNQTERFKGEKETLDYFKNVNNLAENISSFDINNNYIHHVKENIHFYIHDFLSNCKKENIIGVIVTETLKEDLKNLFTIDFDNYEKINVNKNDYNIQLSKLGYEKLKLYLHTDYDCIDKLYNLGCLSNKQYDILSK